MTLKFKPLENIVKDKEVYGGFLVMIREIMMDDDTHYVYKVYPAFYEGIAGTVRTPESEMEIKISHGLASSKYPGLVSFVHTSRTRHNDILKVHQDDRRYEYALIAKLPDIQEMLEEEVKR
jgi:hypothetical protein